MIIYLYDLISYDILVIVRDKQGGVKDNAMVVVKPKEIELRHSQNR